MSTRGWSMTLRATDGDRLLASAQGFKWETPISQMASGVTIGISSGVQHYTMFPLFPGETINGILVRVTGAGGASITLLKLGIVAIGGGLLASTADVKAAFNGTTGLIGGDLAAPYTPSAYGAAYACIVATGSTLPTIARANNAYAAVAFGAGAVGGGLRSGLTDISASAPSSGAQPHIYFAGY